MNAAIRFEQVSKKFILQRQRPQSLQELLLNLFHRRHNGTAEEFWVLRDVSFEVAPGEVVGLIGINGAGKSTVLKLVSRILQPNAGQIHLNGRVAALLELGTGFHPDLTGRENIYLNGAILGLSHAQIRHKLDEIIDFAELDRFIDVPIKHYSSGMYVRLGFAVAVHTDPEILLVDEILAVGDYNFQAKCLRKINDLKEAGLTILFVSHSMDLIRHICNRALWLDQGRVKEYGHMEQVFDAYLNHLAAEKNEANLSQPAEDKEGHKSRWGSGEVEVTRLEFLDDDNRPGFLFATGSPLTIRIHYHAHSPIETPNFGLAFHHAESNTHLSGPNSVAAGCKIQRVEGSGYVDYRMHTLPFLAGDYHVTAAIYDQKGAHAYDHRHQLGYFSVKETSHQYGLVHIPATWSTPSLQLMPESRRIPDFEPVPGGNGSKLPIPSEQL
jgi:lipopolysaccharide transport system ATP-binding protein